MVPLKEIAWHTASNKRKQLKSSDPPAWWQKRWPFFKKPTDLACWAGYPNSNSVGIDLLAHGNGAITPGYTEKQYESLAKLVAALCKDLDISIKREYILGHEDVDPISRGTKTSGWDPGEKFDYDKFMAMVVTKTFANEGDSEPKPVSSLPKDSPSHQPPTIDLSKFTPVLSKFIKGFMGIFKK